MDDEQRLLNSERAEEQPLTKKEREIQNNINTQKNAAEVATNINNPYAKAIGYAYKAADNITEGESSKYIAQKTRMVNKIAPGGRRIQKTSNKLSEKGIGDKIGKVASMKNMFSKGAAGKSGTVANASNASKIASKAGSSSKAEKAADKFKNLYNKTDGYDDSSVNSSKKATLGSVLKKGGKNIWKKLPLNVKLYIIGGAALLGLLLLVIVFVSSYNPLGLISLGNSNDKKDFENKFAETYYHFCGSEEECTAEEWARDLKMLEDQFWFYSKLNTLINTDLTSIGNSYEKNRIKAIIITTIALDVSFDEFVAGADGAFSANESFWFDELKNWVVGSQFTQDMDTIEELYVQFFTYAAACEYDVTDSEGNVSKEKYYMVDSNGEPLMFNLLEQNILRSIHSQGIGKVFNIFSGGYNAILSSLGLNNDLSFSLPNFNANTFKDTMNAIKDCNNNFSNGAFKLEFSSTTGLSEEAYWKYLLTSNFLDKRKTLADRYESHAVSNNLSQDVNDWNEEDKQKVRAVIIEDIKSIVNTYFDVEDSSSSTRMPLLASAYCSNGITIEGVGTMNLEEYLIGVLNGEFGSILFNRTEAAKVAAIAARTIAVSRTKNCSSSIQSGTNVQVYKPIQPGDVGYDVYKAAVNDTSGMVLIDGNGNVTGGHYLTIPNREYLIDDGENVTMMMQGYAGNDKSNYSYTMSWDDIERIARPVGGILWPDAGSTHHWGISAYALIKMDEDGYSYTDIVEQTYGVGGLLIIGKSAYSGDIDGLTINGDKTFKMRVRAADPRGLNPFYNFAASNYGQCAWYAMERADEILTTMGWYKTKAWIAYDGIGGNGNDYCSHPAYAGYDHYTDINGSQTFKPGYLISWDSGQYGHVAVIEDVIGDNVIISEAWVTNPAIGHQIIRTISKKDLITYSGTKEFICTIDLSSGRD